MAPELTQQNIDLAERRMQQTMDASPLAVGARYDAARERIVVQLGSGVELVFPPRLTEGLAGAGPEALSDIEITLAGLGLYWPKLDADLYLPALAKGILGSRSWMRDVAAELGRRGGQAVTPAKQSAAQRNGKLGGRPRKVKTVGSGVRSSLGASRVVRASAVAKSANKNKSGRGTKRKVGVA